MKSGNLPYVILGLVAHRSDGVHGYQLTKELAALSEDFWYVNYGRLYRVLDRLERCGEVKSKHEVQEGRPNRRVYSITKLGSESLEGWLDGPAADNSQPLRDELSLKLLFLGRGRVDDIFEQVRHQRSVYLTRMARVKRRRKRLEKFGFDMQVAGLILDQAEMRVHSDLGWLDHIERKLLRVN